MAATELYAGAALAERYRLERVLGTGGMASVWLAEDSRLHRDVAVKVLSDTLALDQDYRIRFEREARLAAGLSHPNLVGIYDFSGRESRPYLVMEYVPGGTLADRLRTGRPEGLDVEELIRVLLGALGYIHAAGIIHRDIKPANVLMGGDGRPRLTDFGVARPAAESGITRTGLVIGTVRYIAPEVMAGGVADERTDLYACGVLLRECLGDRPDPKLQAVADRLTAEAPEARPASAANALALLDDVTAATRSGHPPAPTAPTRIRPPVESTAATRGHGRHTRPRTPAIAAGLAAAAIVLIVLIAVLSSGGGSHASPHPGPGAPPAAQAPISQQLGYLDQAIGTARQ